MRHQVTGAALPGGGDLCQLVSNPTVVDSQLTWLECSLLGLLQAAWLDPEGRGIPSVQSLLLLIQGHELDIIRERKHNQTEVFSAILVLTLALY